MVQYDVLIVGTGHGGAQAAIALRQRKFDGTIAILGEDPDIPYERPPLSKDYLSGGKSFDRILIRPSSFWTERYIALLTGRRVISIDPVARTVSTESGEVYGYIKLIWAAGGHARQLQCDGHDLAGVHSIRNRGDVDKLVGELGSRSAILIVGGGYIGLEAAAVLTGLGKKVTVLEAQDRVLARVTGTVLSRFYEEIHRAQGVEFRLGSTVECLEEIRGRVSAVCLADGERIAADLVIVGIGIVPSIRPLVEAGARAGNGVVVDEYCRTSIPDVFAIGDCALHTRSFADGGEIRLESVQNANDMALTVAKGIVGDPEPYDFLPWFWSDQYDLKLQTIGLSVGHDRQVIRGNLNDKTFSVVYLKGGHVVALDCVNATLDFVHGRRLVSSRVAASIRELADPAIPLKEI